MTWYAIPSKRPADEAQRCLNAWRDRGYLTGCWRDNGDEAVDCDLLMRGEYLGYPAAVNALVAEIFESDSACDWVVTGGDDVYPDMLVPPDRIEADCTRHFRGTFGVMQPTGDRWGARHPGDSSYSDRVCYSPWMGRDFCRRMYGGRGPLYEGYTHMFCDEELQNVALGLGVLWQRPDLTHLHKHWGRFPTQKAPAFLAEVNSPAHWTRYKNLFDARKAAGFPGHEPLPIAA